MCVRKTYCAIEDIYDVVNVWVVVILTVSENTTKKELRNARYEVGHGSSK